MLKVGAMGNESSLANAMSSCAKFGLKVDAARDAVAQVSGGVGRWKARFRKAGVSGDDIDLLARFIDRDDLREQRAQAVRSAR